MMHCGKVRWGGGSGGGREGGKRQRGGAFLVVFLRQEAEDEFTHAQEVDHLGNAEQRGDDQRSAVRPLQEGRGTLVAQDFPAEEEDEGQEERNTWTTVKKGVAALHQITGGFDEILCGSDFSAGVFHSLCSSSLEAAWRSSQLRLYTPHAAIQHCTQH